MSEEKSTIIALATEIVSAYVSNNKVEADQIPALIQSIYSSLTAAGVATSPLETPAPKLTPAQIKKSITPEALISFVDGKPYKTLKRHLSTHGMTLDEYKLRYGLPHNYSSTAPSYSEKRSAMARSMGVGSRPGLKKELEALPAKALSEGRGRSRAVAAGD